MLTRVGALVVAFLLCGWAPAAESGSPIGQCPGYRAPQRVGTLATAPLREISGIVESSYPGAYWIHNDGAGAHDAGEVALYLIDLSGRRLATVRVLAPNSDWEALATAFGDEGRRILYIGDIGDNARDDEQPERPEIVVYRLEEPEVDLERPDATPPVTPVPYPASYPDGPRDAESLFVDTPTGRLCIISKRDIPPRLYCYPDRLEKLAPRVRVMLERIPVEWFPLPADIALLSPTDASNALDGSVAIRNDWTVHVYRRQAGDSLRDMFARRPLGVLTGRDLEEPQGEAVTFDHSVDPPAIVTTGEWGRGGTSSPIYRATCGDRGVSVTLTEPADGAVVWDVVRIAATAASSVPIQYVEFAVDGVDYGFVRQPPYALDWPSWDAATTTAVVTVRAYDLAWNEAVTRVTVRIDRQPPQVAITAPRGGASVTGIVTVSATAIDEAPASGVAWVQFYVDDFPLGEPIVRAPYEVRWDTGLETDGAHVLTAIARDRAGNERTSAAVAVRVQHPPN